ncbi:hypothetical protein ACLRGA_20125 [Acinetobacter baumannii]|uniref:hypothetical protein n=1 Tax=Acinetobacter baumannii TaxID=470 RepID=UPI0039A6B921
MDNYKIKVKDEAESKEAQELFEQLGYSNGQSKRFGFVYTQNGEIGCDSMEHWDYYNDLCQELTLPKLRDLVVLKRNDVKDANCIDKKREAWYLASDGTYYAWQYRKLCWDTESDACVEAHDIKPINQPQDPVLISGAEAKLAWAKGVDIQIKNVNCVNWYDLDESKYNLNIFDHVRVVFRLKPQTIKLELEIPAPYKAKIGGRDDTSFVLNVGRHQYCYKTEEDYTKARDALEAVFDSAVRGTNS